MIATQKSDSELASYAIILVIILKEWPVKQAYYRGRVPLENLHVFVGRKESRPLDWFLNFLTYPILSTKLNLGLFRRALDLK